MSEAEPRHLEPGQIIEAAAGSLMDEPALKHLEMCGSCQADLVSWKKGCDVLAKLRMPPQAGAVGTCPDLEELASFVSGPAKEGRDIIVEHLSKCERCAAIVSGGLEGDTQETPLALRSSTAKWQREMADRFARESKKPAVNAWRYASVAAAVLIAIAAGWWWRERQLAGDPVTLLAQAYTDARPFEYRLPDRGFGPVRQSRGSGPERPLALSKADVEIQERLKAKPRDPDLMAMKGQAELLEGKYESAMEPLTLALESKPDDPEILSELATAYALRGRAEKRNIDLGHALDLYLRALKKRPDSLRDRFNLAFIYESLLMYDEAVAAWKDVLERNPGPGWREEAEKRKADLEERIGASRKAARELVRDPAEFVAAFAKLRSFDAERYHEILWSDWLKDVATDTTAEAAARLEAEEFERRFRDPYLREIVAAAKGPGRIAVLDLLHAVASNQAGHADEAAEPARRAIPALHAAGIIAGELRAKIELSYSYRFAKDYPKCIGLNEEVLRTAKALPYAWLTAQAHLEHAGCTEQVSKSGAARAEVTRTVEFLEAAGLKLVGLRARGYVTFLDRMSGNVPVWDNARDGLAAYWGLSASPYRALDFLFNMQWSARAMGWLDAAVAMDRAAVLAVSRTKNADIETSNRLYLVELLREAGEYEAAATEVRRAQKLLVSLEPGPTRGNLPWQVSLGRLEVEVAAGRAGAVIREIAEMSENARSMSAAERMRYHQVYGLALVRTGDWSKAASEFEKAIEENQKKAGSLESYLDRLPVLQSAAASYGNLAEIQLTRLHDAKKALSTWLQYQDASGSETNESCIVYAALPSSVAIWTVDGRRVTYRLLDVGSKQVQASCRRFLRLCAVPNSPEGELETEARRLREWLIEPELKDLPQKTLRIRADASLAGIPFSVLLRGSHHAEWANRRVVFLTGPNRPAGAAAQISRESSALVVAVAKANAPEGGQLPYLTGAEQEAAEVSQQFKSPTVLRGPEATPDALALNASRTDVFHFSGHGWANGGNGALILPAGPDGGTRFANAADLGRQNWRRCSLAVLSACLTAAGEGRGAVNNQSLVQAMLNAGARNVIAARWSVDSAATHALMGRFYRRLMSGEEVADALSEASAEVARMDGWRHPYYWAAFDVFTPAVGR